VHCFKDGDVVPIQIFKMTKLYKPILILIAVSAVIFFLFTPKKLHQEREFLFRDISKIYQIKIKNTDGNWNILERTTTGWKYNNQFVARPNAIENLLDAISKIQIQYRPSRAAHANILQSFSNEGIEVELYHKNQKLLKSYTLGGSTADERGTYAMLKGSAEIFVTELPGWTGNLRYRYNLIGDDWRDKTIFALKPSDIKEVALLYPKNTSLSFILKKNGTNFEITNPFTGATKKADFQKSMAYLRNYNQLIAEAFENTNPLKDSLMGITPFCQVTIINQSSDTLQVKFNPIQSEKERRYFAASNSGDLFLVQHRVFGSIFASASDFE
jgi:hypothetical protein